RRSVGVLARSRRRPRRRRARPSAPPERAGADDRSGRVLGRAEGERQLLGLRVDVDVDGAAALEGAEEELVDQAALDRVVEEASHRPGAVELVVAALGDPLAGGVGEGEADVAIEELEL